MRGVWSAATVCCSYPTGPYVTDITGDGGELVSADLLIPYTTWLRPVILFVAPARCPHPTPPAAVAPPRGCTTHANRRWPACVRAAPRPPCLRYFMSQQMRASSNHLAITVVRSYSVWALTASFLVVSAILSTAFFQNTQVADPDAPQFEEGLGRAFQDFRSSFLSMCAPSSGHARGAAQRWAAHACGEAVGSRDVGDRDTVAASVCAGSSSCARPPTSRTS